MHAEFSARREPTAAASFAAIFDHKRFGIAMATMIKIMVTTMSNSMSENPFCCLPHFISIPQTRRPLTPPHSRIFGGQLSFHIASAQEGQESACISQRDCDLSRNNHPKTRTDLGCGAFRGSIRNEYRHLFPKSSQSEKRLQKEGRRLPSSNQKGGSWLVAGRFSTVARTTPDSSS